MTDVWDLDSAAVPANVDDVDGDICNDGSILKTITKKGEAGGNPPEGSKITCHYVGTLLDGSKFDSSRDRSSPFNFTLGSGVITGWSEGVATMKKGEIADFTIVSDKAYGASGSPPKIPGGATLKFEIELISWESDGSKDVSKFKDGGIMKTLIEPGTIKNWQNPKPLGEAVVNVKFKVKDGPVVLDTTVDGVESLKFIVGDLDVIQAIDEAVLTMSRGEIAKFEVSPSYAYGVKGDEAKGVAPHSPLVGVIELVDFTNVKEDYEQDSERLEQAVTMRQQGNELFKQKKFKQAIARYSFAILAVGAHFVNKGADELKEANETVLPCYLNKAACLLKLNQNTQAKECCEKALVVDPTNVKGLYRLGCALTAIGEWKTAVDTLKRCLDIDSKNSAATTALKKAKGFIAGETAKARKMFGGMFDKMAAADAKKTVAPPVVETETKPQEDEAKEEEKEKVAETEKEAEETPKDETTA